MNLQKAIESFDSHRANALTLKEKVEWVSQLDYKIYSELLAPRGEILYNGYDVHTSLETRLLAPEEYGEIYTLYLTMKLDFKNSEIGRYNNSAILFNRTYMEMSDFINRKSAVKKKTKIKAGDLYV